MARIQRTGLIVLALLLLVAVVSLLFDGRKPRERDFPPSAAVLDPGLAVEFLPPERRQVFLSPRDFLRDPVRHPLRGGSGPDINRSALDLGSGPAASLSSPPAASSARPPSGRLGRVIRVREGETLRTLAARELGSEELWEELAVYNGIDDPRKLRIGQKLVIPEGVALPAPAAGRKSAAVPPAVPPLPAVYTVQKGDTAGEISQKIYGTSRLWQKLLQANGIDDPLKLRAGQVLKVPPR